MLSLTLKEGDYLMIGDNIRVQFLEDLSANYMRIGIDAPKSVNIARGKPYEKALSEDIEKNAEKLKEIEVQKQIQIIEKQKALEKKRERKKSERERKAAKEKAEQYVETVNQSIEAQEGISG